MLFPIICIFEFHWDQVPKLVTNHAISELSKQGYDTFCIEAPHEASSSIIIERLLETIELSSTILFKATELLQNKNIMLDKKLSDMSLTPLTQLMMLHVSSERFNEVAEKIKHLPAELLLKETFENAKRCRMTIKGVDVREKDFNNMIGTTVLNKWERIKKNEENRINTMVKKLLELKKAGRGIVFLCGASHAHNLFMKFKEYELQEEILAYLPHSSQTYDDNFAHILDAQIINQGSLDDCTFLLSTEEAKNFGKKIVKDLRKEIPEGTIHSKHLSKHFSVNFKAFMRPGYYVDAMLNKNVVEIGKTLKKHNIEIHYMDIDELRWLVISNINIKEIAQKIFEL